MKKKIIQTVLAGTLIASPVMGVYENPITSYAATYSTVVGADGASYFSIVDIYGTFTLTRDGGGVISSVSVGGTYGTNEVQNITSAYVSGNNLVFVYQRRGGSTGSVVFENYASIPDVIDVDATTKNSMKTTSTGFTFTLATYSKIKPYDYYYKVNGIGDWIKGSSFFLEENGIVEVKAVSRTDGSILGTRNISVSNLAFTGSMKVRTPDGKRTITLNLLKNSIGAITWIDWANGTNRQQNIRPDDGMNYNNPQSMFGYSWSGSDLLIPTSWSVWGQTPLVNRTVRVYDVYTAPAAPTSPVITPNITDPTNSDVTLSISYNSSDTKQQYRVNSGSWTTYTAPVVMTSNGTLEARAGNALGDYSSIASYTVSNIDKTAPTKPTLSSNKTTATNGNVIVTVTYPSDAVKKEVKIGSTGTWVDYVNPVELTDNNTVYARATDAVGNVSAEGSLVVSNIDRTPPVAATFTPDKTALTNTDVKVTIKYPGDASVKQYKIGENGVWTTYSSVVSMTANDTIYARSSDAAGNMSVESTYEVTNIDKIAPTVPTLVPDKTTGTNSDVKVTITYPSDATIKEYKVGATGTWTSYTSAVSVASNDTIYARATDAAGNTSAESSLTITNIDKTAPVAATFTADKTALTNTDVNVTITYPSDAETKQYKVGASGSWANYTSAVKVSSNDTIYARSMDEAGNVSVESSYLVNNIDKVAPTAPTLNADKTTATNSDVKVTVTFPSDAVTKQYRIGASGSWTNYSTAIVLTANNTIFARAIDAAGNVSDEGALVVSNIDKVAPDGATLEADKTTATNTDVKVTITYPSDAVTKQYKIGSNGTWTSYTSAVMMSNNDTIFARSMDAVGNTSVETSLVVSNIDKTAPAVATFVADKTAPTNSAVKVTITYPSDAVTKQYKVGSAGAWTTYSGTVVMSENDTIFARSMDEAGNTSVESSYEVKNIDHEAPIKPTLTADVTRPTNGDVKITIIYSSDATTKQYKIGENGAWTAYSSPVTLTVNGSVYARAIDAAGNISDEAILAVDNIDKTAPDAATFVADKTSPTNTDVKVVISYPSDAVTKQYKVGAGGAWTNYTSAVTMSTNGSIFARSIDAVGNISVESSFDVANIDKEAPVQPTLVADTTTPTSGEVKVTVTYSSDTANKQYKIGSAGNWTVYTEAVVMTVNETIYARAIDAAGNVSAESSLVVSNIDKSVPEKATLVADMTTPTNATVKVTISYPNNAVTKQYKVGTNGTWTSYSTAVELVENATVYARSFNGVGTVSEESSLEVLNIDKTLPTKPIINVTGDKLTIVAGTDDSGIALTEYKLNNGSWMVYNGEITLPDGQYKVLARSTDNAGNVGEESTLDILVYANALKAVEEAEKAPSQTKIDQAESAINVLPDVPEKQELEERLDEVKKYQSIQNEIDYMNNKLDSGNFTIEDVDNFKKRVDELIDITNTISNRIDNDPLLKQLEDLKKKLDLIKSVFDGASDGDPTDIDEGQIGNLPDGDLKDKLEDIVDNTKAIKDATEAVEKAEETKTQEDKDIAQEKVDKLPDGKVKDDLQDRLDAIKPGQNLPSTGYPELDKIVDPVVRNLLLDVTRAVERAERNFVRANIIIALDKVAGVPLSIQTDSRYKKIFDNLNSRASTLKTTYNDAITNQTFQQAITKATGLVEKYEKYGSASYKKQALDAIAKLPDGIVKEGLLARMEEADKNK